MTANLSTRIGYDFIRVWVSFTIGSGGVPPRLRIFLSQRFIDFTGAGATRYSTRYMSSFWQTLFKGEDLVGVNTQTSGTHQDVLKVIIADKEALYDSYMSFLRNGGLFIQTSQEYRLGDEVLVLLKLLDQPRRCQSLERWCGSRPKARRVIDLAGIGIEFSRRMRHSMQR